MRGEHQEAQWAEEVVLEVGGQGAQGPGSQAGWPASPALARMPREGRPEGQRRLPAWTAEEGRGDQSQAGRKAQA